MIKKIVFRIRMTADLLRRIEIASREDCMKSSEYVRSLVIEDLNKRNIK